jgi:hypothetical protein
VAVIDYNSLTVKQLKESLDEKGIPYKTSDTKSELIKLLEGS